MDQATTDTATSFTLAYENGVCRAYAFGSFKFIVQTGTSGFAAAASYNVFADDLSTPSDDDLVRRNVMCRAVVTPGEIAELICEVDGGPQFNTLVDRGSIFGITNLGPTAFDANGGEHLLIPVS